MFNKTKKKINNPDKIEYVIGRKIEYDGSISSVTCDRFIDIDSIKELTRHENGKIALLRTDTGLYTFNVNGMLEYEYSNDSDVATTYTYDNGFIRTIYVKYSSDAKITRYYNNRGQEVHCKYVHGEDGYVFESFYEYYDNGALKKYHDTDGDVAEYDIEGNIINEIKYQSEY